MRKSKQSLLLEHESRAGGGGGGSESYSSNSSFSDSYSDGSDLANWEEHVGEDGSLFYAEYVAHAALAGSGTTPDKQRVEFARNSSLRMGKKARRQQQQQKSSTEQQQQQSQQQPPHEFLLAHIKSPAHALCKQLELVISAADRYRYGRRSTAIESILGFRVVPYADQPECLMVESFVHDIPEVQQAPEMVVQRGDWFYSLDDIEIRANNVDALLLQFVQPTQVRLKFLGAALPSSADAAQTAMGGAATSATVDNSLQKITNYAAFADVFEKLQLTKSTTTTTTSSTSTDNSATQLPFAYLLIPPECYQQDEHKDSLFYYPADKNLNFLYKARGSFLTLNAVLTEELLTPPLLSQLSVDNVPYFVCYRPLNGFLMLFAYCGLLLTQQEAALRADELLTYLRYALPTLQLADFTNGNEEGTLGGSELRTFLTHFCQVQRVRVLAAHHQLPTEQSSSMPQQQHQPALFEQLLPGSRYMPLPKEAQLRIFDALSEMEAMDYRNWNDEPLHTHREFFIHGSVLYYDHLLLVAQLPLEARLQVESFLRCSGIFEFITAHGVKELFVWQELQLPHASGRYFLIICARGHLMLGVILKLFDVPEEELPTQQSKKPVVVPPSLFYIEEIQETLAHLTQCGIESLAMFWSLSNKRPEVLDRMEPPAGTESKTRKFETLLKQKLSSSSGAAAAANKDEDEIAQLCSSLGGSSIHSQTPSEEDANRKRGGASSSNIGAHNAGDDSDSGSDWDDFTAQNPLHYGDFEGQTQMTESLWKEINNVVPINISPGWRNSIYYFIYVDTANSSIFTPTKVHHETFPFMREMRSACHVVHEELQRAKKEMVEAARTSATPPTTNNINEHGMTLVVREKPKEPGTLGAVRGRFSLVGRLFDTPEREILVCHKPEVPQNLIELAFRLSFFTAG